MIWEHRRKGRIEGEVVREDDTWMVVRLSGAHRPHYYSEANRGRVPRPVLFVRTPLDLKHVRVDPILHHPGHYAVHLAELNDADLHVTAALWDAIDAKVRAGIIAAQTRAVAL